MFGTYKAFLQRHPWKYDTWVDVFTLTPLSVDSITAHSYFRHSHVPLRDEGKETNRKTMRLNAV